MSDLIPNLNALQNKLPPRESATDVHAFVDALAKAQDSAEANANVDALVDLWLEERDGDQ
ncbi:hypothetical protein H9L21_01055 [Aeromicrobium senzhongii]|uniref:DUF2281 domain-containing protein n=1 Tax=Aeromicrobium senzhongii TaxID=2663859 RepID=A0ABX6STK7_9ACTN|nr:hypothetical protein [Aeromicrobium senzhongii]QNL94597.1 hypothetical protein H9L21_01055 [Aeromicrobium senzhongii]